MLILNLYAIYDKRAKTLGTPFIGANDEVAREKLRNTFIELDKEKSDLKFDKEVLTVLNLGYIRMTIIENKDNKGMIRSYEPCIFKNNEIYDINDVFDDVKIRNEILPDVTVLKE